LSPIAFAPSALTVSATDVGQECLSGNSGAKPNNP
jgi:hypothetical protein